MFFLNHHFKGFHPFFHKELRFSVITENIICTLKVIFYQLFYYLFLVNVSENSHLSCTSINIWPISHGTTSNEVQNWGGDYMSIPGRLFYFLLNLMSPSKKICLTRVPAGSRDYFLSNTILLHTKIVLTKMLRIWN